MRLDARKGDVGWSIYDVEKLCVPKWVVWIDEESATWGQAAVSFDGRLITAGGEVVLNVHKERRITVYPGARMVLFNEVDLEGKEPAAAGIVGASPIM